MTTPGATPEQRAREVVAKWEHGSEEHRQWLRDIAIPDVASVIREAEANALRRAAEWKATHQHYKGGLYRVIGEAVHTETSAFLTIYDNEQGNIFARPQGMFCGTIEDGSPRFRSLLPKEEGK